MAEVGEEVGGEWVRLAEVEVGGESSCNHMTDSLHEA